MNFKEINIGKLIHERSKELEVDHERICKFLDCTEEEITKMYTSEHIDTRFLLRWSKLLEYDFFRIYSQHLILFAPSGNTSKSTKRNGNNSGLPVFRKNIYTREVIFFILELIQSNEKSTFQIIDEYGIPKNTLYNWIKKYENEFKTRLPKNLQ